MYFKLIFINENIISETIYENIVRYLLKFITTLYQTKNFCLNKFYYTDVFLRLGKTSRMKGKHRLYEIKQLRFIENTFVSLTNLFVNLVYKVSEMYLPYGLNFSKIALVGFQCEPVSLDVNKVCFYEE